MRNEIVVVKRRERGSEGKGKIMKKKGKRTQGKKRGAVEIEGMRKCKRKKEMKERRKRY